MFCKHSNLQIPSSLAAFKCRLALPFLYRLAQVVLEKRPLNGCSSSSNSSSSTIFCKAVFISAGEDDTLYIRSACGLFPLPIAKHVKPSALFRIKSKFQFVGKFLAKALVDSRMVCSFSFLFYQKILRCWMYLWCYQQKLSYIFL